MDIAVVDEELITHIGTMKKKGNKLVGEARIVVTVKWSNGKTYTINDVIPITLLEEKK